MGAAGYRRNGRWKYGSVEFHGSVKSRTSQNDLSRAGVVLDYLPELLDEIIAGNVALDDAHRQAKSDAGWTQQRIRDVVGLPRETVRDTVAEMATWPNPPSTDLVSAAVDGSTGRG